MKSKDFMSVEEEMKQISEEITQEKNNSSPEINPQQGSRQRSPVMRYAENNNNKIHYMYIAIIAAIAIIAFIFVAFSDKLKTDINIPDCPAAPPCPTNNFSCPSCNCPTQTNNVNCSCPSITCTTIVNNTNSS